MMICLICILKSVPHSGTLLDLGRNVDALGKEGANWDARERYRLRLQSCCSSRSEWKFSFSKIRGNNAKAIPKEWTPELAGGARLLARCPLFLGCTPLFSRRPAFDANRKRFCPKSLEERKLEIPTTTTNTLKLHTSVPLPRPYTCGTPPELHISIPL